ncbi:MAG: M23 family metallopeptidase [Bacteroidales bacterium]|nr:M23 family metallopeptidase [Bacteroidales bacterium]
MARQNKDVKVRRLRIALTDDESHKELWVKSLPKATFIFAVISSFVIAAALFFMLFAFTPLKTFIPGYPDARTRQEAIRNAIKIDSLENAVARWAFYSDNLLRIVEGKEPVSLDSLIKTVSDTSIDKRDVKRMAANDSLLRVKVAAEEQFAVSDNTRSLTIEGMQFFTPLKGVISKPYDAVMHPYLDIAGPAGSPVMAVLGGTVIGTWWDAEMECVTYIQHENDIVTAYKHSQKNLRKAGDKVAAGSAIAIVGDHLHLEVWYKGKPVDPSKYINF